MKVKKKGSERKQKKERNQIKTCKNDKEKENKRRKYEISVSYFQVYTKRIKRKGRRVKKKTRIKKNNGTTARNT